MNRILSKEDNKTGMYQFKENDSQLDISEYWDMLSDIDDTVLTQEEEIEYFKRIEAGDEEARQEFIRHNLRLVISIAKEFQNINKRKLLTMEDLIQEGNLSLCKVIDKFDYKLGNKFSTYAVDWIKQGMEKAVDEQGRTIKIPPSRITVIKQYKKRESDIQKETGQKPKFEEVMKYLPYTEEYVKYCLGLGIEPLSLSYQDNSNNSDVAGYTLNDILSDQSDTVEVESTEDKINKEFLHEEMQKFLNNILEGKDLELIELMFGITDDSKSYTLTEISKRLGIPLEQLKVKEHHALQKVRNAINNFERNLNYEKV